MRARILLLLLLSGCNCAETHARPEARARPVAESEAPESDPEVAPRDDDFVYASLNRVRAPAPPRFGAALPASVAAASGAWSEGGPPRAYVRDQLCAGDAQMGARLATAVDAARSAGGTVPELMDAYGRLVEYCGSSTFCTFAATEIGSRERSEAYRAVLWTGFARCPAADVEPHVAQPDVPARSLVWFHRARTFEAPAETLPMPERLSEAVRSVVETETGPGAQRQMGLAVGTLLRFRGGADAVIALHEALPAKRRAIGLELFSADDARLRRLFREACEGHEDEDYRCGRDPPTARPAARPQAPSVAARVRGYDFDAVTFVDAAPDQREAVVAALARCGATEGYEGARCLGQLARLDWGRARVIAADVPGDEELVQNLRRYEARDGLAARLVELDLLADVPENPGLTVEQVLEMEGCLTRFDTETGMFPNEHDSLLRQLRALAPSALEGALFREIAPVSEGLSYTLVAYVDGESFSTSAENLGDWYDMNAVIGMLNELARLTGNATRWMVMPTGDQTAIVVAGPAEGLRRAVEEGLIRRESGDAAREAGQEFENRVLEALRGQEGIDVVE